jgi:hypothetical protein
MDAWKPPISDRIRDAAALIASALAFDMLLIMLLIF